MTSMIVPVWLSHEKNPHKESLVYAILDNQSDKSFILDKTAEDMNLPSTDVPLLMSTMLAENQLILSSKIYGLSVRGFNNPKKIKLPALFTRDIMPASRSHIPSPETTRKWPHLQKLETEIPELQNCTIALLLGTNAYKVLEPDGFIPSGDSNGPFAIKTDLGWSLVGPASKSDTPDDDYYVTSHHILSKETIGEGNKRLTVTFAVKTAKVKEVFDMNAVLKVLESDFVDSKQDNAKPMSRNDKKFVNLMTEGIRVTNDQHFEMPLPFKDSKPSLPNNKEVAKKRLGFLHKRFQRDPKYKEDYTAFMKDIFDRGYAEKVPPSERTSETQGSVWYIPHHGVYHPKKPGKIRVVFDCSAKYQGVCLNDILLQGPDLINPLIGVLSRFRKDQVAFVCDVEKMFFQFSVREDHRDFFRFLWWEHGNYETEEPTEFRMRVHLFGAVSSPSVANFGLQQAANDGENMFGSETADFVRSDFYVDDGLKSVATEDAAISLIINARGLCANRGLRLHKFVSNSSVVLDSIPLEDRAKCVENLDLLNDAAPIERVLGVQWAIDSDCFQFRITLKDRPATRRGILSAVSSVYDPLGFLAPFVLNGKRILQDICKLQVDWDVPLSGEIVDRWQKWCCGLTELEKLKIPRCFKPKNFGPVKTVELHHFSDASFTGYGQSSYLRLVDEQGQVHCSLVLGKARVTPLRQVSIPRLELTAAVLSVKMSSLLRNELKYDNIAEYFWSDSKVVLGYIANEARRFHVFVGNRVQQIRDVTEVDQWNYVQTKDNPADCASRGLTADSLVNSSTWFSGPQFLWSSNWQEYVDSNPIQKACSSEDPEVKKVTVLGTQAQEHQEGSDLERRVSYFSTWYRAKRAIANCVKYVQIVKNRVHGSKQQVNRTLTVADLKNAEALIIQSVQQNAFESELEILTSLTPLNDRISVKKRKATIRKASSIYRLDPFVDSSGLLRVGGRLKAHSIDDSVKHPLLLPRKGHVTNLIIRHSHEKTHHQGRGMTVNELRSSGYWIIGMSSAVAHYIRSCTVCRKWRGHVVEQKMADLPEDRMEIVPPFTYCAVDLFGPFTIKEGRKELKRYGVLFTCLSSRAIHLETAIDLTTDSFINSLRRFISIRGPIRQLRCDQGTNFVGAQRELAREAQNMNQQKIQQFLRANNCDVFEFKMNVPAASHMGGVWERQIRTVRSILINLLEQNGTQLDDESLRTLLCETAAIVNSRPLTTDNLNDPTSLEPLTPNHLITMKSKVILAPPGDFQQTDTYSRKRWKRVQYLANVFWSRWRNEYLSSLQMRQKWTKLHRDIQKGDVVLLKDENLARNCWALCRVEETYPSGVDGKVRKVKLRIGDPSLDKKGKRVQPESYLDRPVQKVVLLLENETG